MAIHFHTHNINFTQNGFKGEEKFQFLYKISCCVRFYLRFFHLVYRLVLDAVRFGVFIKLTATINFQAHEKWYLGKKVVHVRQTTDECRTEKKENAKAWYKRAYLHIQYTTHYNDHLYTHLFIISLKMTPAKQQKTSIPSASAAAKMNQHNRFSLLLSLLCALAAFAFAIIVEIDNNNNNNKMLITFFVVVICIHLRTE